MINNKNGAARPLTNMGSPKTIWAISAVHSDLERLTSIHDEILGQFKTGDRLLYHGNYTGYGLSAADTIDEILAFRRMILSQAGVLPTDFIYLRGQQEEMWEKLLQLPFASEPTNVLLWMLSNGIDPTLRSYGICPHEGIEACRQGTMALNKWVNDIRRKQREFPGHEEFTCSLTRAAHTDLESDEPLLFVHTGLDANKALYDQNDNFWWASEKFGSIRKRYGAFHNVIRGYDPFHRGVQLGETTSTIDGGCGFGGSLICAAIEKHQDTPHIIEK